MDNKQVLKWNNSKRNYPKHHFMLPSPSLRQLIIGSSNCGKTCLLLKLLLNESWLDYNSLYIYGNSLHQPEYKWRANIQSGLTHKSGVKTGRVA